MTDDEQYMVWYNRAEDYILKIALTGFIVSFVGIAFNLAILVWFGASVVTLNPIMGYFVAKMSIKNPGILGRLYFEAQIDACKAYMWLLAQFGMLIIVAFIVLQKW